MHTYYMILRPLGIGCQPKGFVDHKDYGKRTFVPEINHEAWGEVTYDRELSPEEIRNYDLVEKE